MNGKNENSSQLITTILAYTLPLLQFFFGQLTDTVQNLFLFKHYFVVVSVFTAIVSYVMITVLKARSWFDISLLQWRRKKRLREWLVYTNSSVYANDEIKAYQDKHKPPLPLRSIKPDNVIQVVFLPGLLIGFAVFIILGLQYGGTPDFAINNAGDVAKLVAQAMAYAAFLVFAVLSFAHQYIRDAGARAYKQELSNKYEKAIELARKRDVFKELRQISLVTQKSVEMGDPTSLIAFIVAVDEGYYVLVTDSNIDTIIIVKEFSELAEAEAYVWGSGQQTQQAEEPTE